MSCPEIIWHHIQIAMWANCRIGLFKRIIRQRVKEKPAVETARYFQVTRQRVHLLITSFKQTGNYPEKKRSGEKFQPSMKELMSGFSNPTVPAMWVPSTWRRNSKKRTGSTSHITGSIGYYCSTIWRRSSWEKGNRGAMSIWTNSSHVDMAG